MADALDDVASTLREWVEARGFSGTALVAGGGVEWQGCFGEANRSDGVPITPRTRFGVASFTKMLTATTVVSLMAERDLPYDAPVVHLLPAERRPSTLRDDVTVHHLLSHTSGIADYYEEDEEEGNDSYAELWAERPAYGMRSPADFLPMFGDRPPYGPPGKCWRYSNAGYVLLGLIIEQLAGEAFTDAVQRRVLDPSGMSDSGFFSLEEARRDIATGYLKPTADGEPWRSNIYAIPAVGGPDGGLFTTAHDIARFLRAYGDGVLVGPRRRDDMLSPHASVDEGISCGYGVFLHEGRGGVRWGHGGQDPGVEMLAYRWRDRDLTIAVLCNVTGFTHEVLPLLLAAVIDPS
jgi:CubicO group peptidase (beta-lactamase class C family)